LRRKALVVEAVQRLCRALDVEFLRGESLAAQVSLRIGGEPLFVARPSSWQSASALLEGLWKSGAPFKVLGGGTNLLIEEGALGFGVLQLRRCGGTVRFDGEAVEADADVPMPALCAQAIRQGLSGLEGMAGIPGLVGGAVVMNAGAYGAEMSSLITHVAVIEQGSGFKWREASSFSFGYRSSNVSSHGVVAGCRMLLKRDERSAIEARFEESKAKRLSSQPWNVPSAGSVFKNPPGDFAGRILEQLGFRGKRRGGAGFSEIHANFLVNHGDATFADAWGLCEEARAAAAKAGVVLDYEMEVWRRAL
jgi:UDP-N-acetylmuramate dehydrogenase